MSELRTWLDAAWQRHDKAARELAHDLHARAPTLPDDDEGAEAVRMARHTLLGHLADTEGLATLLASLPRGEKLDLQRERAQWAADRVAGRPTGEQPHAIVCNLVADVAQAWLHQGRVADARAAVLDLEPAAMADPDTAACRALGATGHNLATDLRLGPRGDAARDALMLDIVHLSRRAWARAGTWMHVERADYDVAMCHAVLGQGGPAVAHAQACLARCEAEGADAAERFFAHECNVHAQRAAGDLAWAAAHRQRMQALLAEVTDAGMKAWCEQMLLDTPP